MPNTLRITRILKKIKPDFVHLHAENYYSLAIILSGLPYVLTSWGIEVLNLQNAGFVEKSLAKVAAGRARKVTVDAMCLQEIWQNLGIPASRIKLIPFGVDLNVFHQYPQRSSIRKSLQIRESDIVVMSTRPFYNHKYDVETLIRAIPLIVRKHGNVKFVLKGSGPLENYLKRLAEKLGVTSYVRFIGLVPYDDIPKHLSAADIYVSTCFIDTTSVSLLEAMACKLAPVVTDIPGNREWVADGVNGLLFSPSNPEALAEKITHMVENPQLREQFGERCLQIVEQRASWDKCFSDMEDIYESLLKEEHQTVSEKGFQ